MENPYSIKIRCDGAMNLDKNQTGGNGYYIEFPDALNLEPLFGSLRNDGQGIHRLEIISIIEAIKRLLNFIKQNPEIRKSLSGVCICTDRYSIPNLVSPWSIQKYKRNKWKTNDGKAVKDRDLLEELDRLIKKLSIESRGMVEIKWVPEKYNKTADKLSKSGKKDIPSRRTTKKNRRFAKRIFNGPEVNYETLKSGDEITIHVYSWEPIQNEFEIVGEILGKKNLGKKLKISVTQEDKNKFHRKHFYEINISEVYKSYIKIKRIKEIENPNSM